jgi:hypothetical protein
MEMEMPGRRVCVVWWGFFCVSGDEVLAKVVGLFRAVCGGITSGVDVAT